MPSPEDPSHWPCCIPLNVKWSSHCHRNLTVSWSCLWGSVNCLLASLTRVKPELEDPAWFCLAVSGTWYPALYYTTVQLSYFNILIKSPFPSLIYNINPDHSIFFSFPTMAVDIIVWWDWQIFLIVCLIKDPETFRRPAWWLLPARLNEKQNKRL